MDPFEYRKATPEQAEQIKAVFEGCRALHDIILERVPYGRARSLAITKLEEVSMWANKGIAFGDDL